MIKTRKKKQKIYDFNYTIYWKNNSETVGRIENSELEPFDIFLTNKMTYFGNGVASYYNADAIKFIEITDYVEKVGE